MREMKITASDISYAWMNESSEWNPNIIMEMDLYLEDLTL